MPNQPFLQAGQHNLNSINNVINIDNINIINNNDSIIDLPRRRSRLIRNYLNGRKLNNNQRHKIYNSIAKQRLIVTNNNIIVNLSTRKLALIESVVLNKGLNYCITNDNKKCINKTIDSDIKTFTRTLQLRYMFASDNSDEKVMEKFTGNPNWKPPKSKCSLSITAYTVFLKEEIKKLIKINKIRHNISRKEREALKSLREDTNILIQKADKGGSIVILNTKEYKTKILNMLNDPVTYTQVQDVNINEAKTQIDNVFLHLFGSDYISKKQKNYLIRCTPKMPVLYGLPKIHKNNWPLRPIVSQIDSPAYKLNKYLDYLLTTAEKSIPNLLQDTTKFLQIVNTLDPMPPGIILFTIDVTSLYTVLPHDLVINYVEEMYTETLTDWQKYTSDVRPVPGYIIKEIIKIVLSQTFFSFDGNNYMQNYGITMGAPSSVKLANITLHKHLIKTLLNYPRTMPLLQLRLIDDIFGIWSGTEEELLNWVKFLNDSHNSIKFTLEFSKVEIPFLDTLVYIENNKIRTRLYKKPTDNKQYLHFSSEHPQHVKKAIPYAQALRYRRIIEDDEILKLELEKLRQNFLIRKYPETIVETAIDRASNLDRLSVIKYNVKKVTNFQSIPFVLTFNNSLVSDKNVNIYKLLTDSWKDLLTTSPDLCTLKAPKIVFKKSNTVNSLLVSTMFPPPRWLVRQNRPLTPVADTIPPVPEMLGKCAACNRLRCRTCNIISENNSFNSSQNDTCFRLNDDFDCNSFNVVYLITCLKCKIQYVGETGNPLHVRMNAHRSCIMLNKDTPIGIHFNSIGHNLTHLSVIPIEKVNYFKNRQTREYFWQLTLGTIFPKGLNCFPVDQRNLFKKLEMSSLVDLDVFWTLKYLESNTDDSDSD
jgi:GIY-YIG catalytic domain